MFSKYLLSQMKISDTFLHIFYVFFVLEARNEAFHVSIPVNFVTSLLVRNYLLLFDFVKKTPWS